MKINAKTKLLGLFGWPVEHSLSPDMHNDAFGEMGLNLCYVALPVPPEALGDAVRAIRAFDMPGVNVTVPHKEKVIQYLDGIDEEARFIGAVNTIVNRDGRLKGYNTDGRGFIQSLIEQGTDYAGKNILVLGAGGGSRAISFYLSEKAKSLLLFDLDRPKLETLTADLSRIRGNVNALDGVDSLEGVDILVNATPLGLKEGDPMPIKPELLKPPLIVGDLIYRETPLLGAARRLGLKTFNGLGMLLWQGVLASELWTGRRPSHETMRRALLRGLGIE